MGWAGCDGGELLLVLLAVRLSVYIHTVECSSCSCCVGTVCRHMAVRPWWQQLTCPACERCTECSVLAVVVSCSVQCAE